MYGICTTFIAAEKIEAGERGGMKWVSTKDRLTRD